MTSEEPSYIRESTSSDVTVARYLGKDYGWANPSWDIEDFPWKVETVRYHDEVLNYD